MINHSTVEQINMDLDFFYRIAIITDLNELIETLKLSSWTIRLDSHSQYVTDCGIKRI